MGDYGYGGGGASIIFLILILCYLECLAFMLRNKYFNVKKPGK